MGEQIDKYLKGDPGTHVQLRTRALVGEGHAIHSWEVITLGPLQDLGSECTCTPGGTRCLNYYLDHIDLPVYRSQTPL
jgi:hypothetical protein